MTTKPKVGDLVIATPKNNDFSFQFSGRVDSVVGNNIIVVDQDGDAFNVDLDQIEYLLGE